MKIYHKFAKINSPSLRGIRRDDLEMHKMDFQVIQNYFEYDIRQTNLYNNKQYICGTQDGSFEALTQNLGIMEQKYPKCVLLDYYSNRQLSKFIGKQIEQDLQQQVIGKSKYTKFFSEVVPESRDIYTINDNNTYVYYANNNRKFMYFQDQLSVAYYACNNSKMNIMISKPDDFRMIEDIVLNFELNELKDIFDNVIEIYKTDALDKEVAPNDGYDEILNQFRNIVQFHHLKLFKNYVRYQCALLHKSSRIFDACALFTNWRFTEKVAQLSTDQYYEFGEVFQSEIETQQYNKIELLEKIVIAGYLYNFEMRQQAIEGQNVFEQTIFKNILNQDDIPLYLQLHSKYSDKLNELQNFIIKTILIKNLEQVKMIRYPQLINQLKQKANNWNYEFYGSFISRAKQSFVLSQLMESQMGKLISDRQAQGINQKDVIKSIQNIYNGVISEKDLINTIKLGMESNAKLGYPIQFPNQLRERFSEFIENSQMERVSKEVSGLEFRQLDDSHFYALLGKKKKQTADDELTDEEDYSDQEEQGNLYIVGDKGEDVPEEIQKMTLKDLQEKGELLGQFDVDQNFDVHHNQNNVDIEQILKYVQNTEEGDGEE